MDSLVTTDWLANHLAEVRIADAGYFLPEHGRDAAADYASGHIPGAVFLDLKTLADPGDPLPSMLPSAARFAERMSALSITEANPIILYDDSPLHSSARAWWMLRHFGARQVAILDGGLTKWRAGGRPLERASPVAAPACFMVATTADDVRSLADMRANLTGGTEQVADARSPARFAGSEPETRPGLAAGHIPGSRNLHYARFFHPDGTWKSGDELRAVFAEGDVDPARPLVATCGSGVTAAVIAFGAHLLGHEAAIYDGSWTEWGSHPDTPKATG